MRFDDRMDGSHGVGAVGANSSSDFVRRVIMMPPPGPMDDMLMRIKNQVRKLYKYGASFLSCNRRRCGSEKSAHSLGI